MSRASSEREPNILVKPPDKTLVIVVAILILTGCWVVFDSSYSFSADEFGDVYFFFKRHLMWISLGIAGMITAACMSLKTLRKCSTVLMLLSLGLMIALLIYGTVTSGAKSWFRFGAFSFQPSEMLKVTLVMYLASALSLARVSPNGTKNINWTIPAVVSCLAVLLTVLQKDFGTASILVMVVLATFFAAGARKRILAQIIFGLVMVPAIIFATGLNNAGPFRHINSRMTAYLHPWDSPQNEAYHTIQSLTAFGTGGWFGRGLCKGRVKMMIPQSYNDFALTTLAEESGLVAMLLLVGVFVALAYRGLEIARMSKSNYGTILASGMTSIISIQALVNLGVVTAAIPATGVPMPFISYGGTAVVFMLIAVGLIFSVSRRSNEELKEVLPDEASVNRGRDRRTHISRRKRRTSIRQIESRSRSAVYR